MLAPLSDAQRERLRRRDGDRRAAARPPGWSQVAPEDPRGEAAQACLAAYFAEIDERFEGGYDAGAGIFLAPQDMAPPRGLLLLARLDGEPVGCGVLWHHGGGVADAKRMWVAPRARGLGLGRRLLAELERHAREAGVRHAAPGHQPGAHGGDRRSTAPPATRRSSASTTSRTPHHWFAKSLG